MVDNMKWKKVESIFAESKELLGNPDIKLVRPSEWKKITNNSLGNFWGKADYQHRIITIGKYTKRSVPQVRNTVIHEIAHLIFCKPIKKKGLEPIASCKGEAFTLQEMKEVERITYRSTKPHWWIECFADKIARTNFKSRWTQKYNKSNRMLPKREVLIEMAKESIKKYGYEEKNQ